MFLHLLHRVHLSNPDGLYELITSWFCCHTVTEICKSCICTSRTCWMEQLAFAIAGLAEWNKLPDFIRIPPKLYKCPIFCYMLLCKILYFVLLCYNWQFNNSNDVEISVSIEFILVFQHNCSLCDNIISFGKRGKWTWCAVISRFKTDNGSINKRAIQGNCWLMSSKSIMLYPCCDCLPWM